MPKLELGVPSEAGDLHKVMVCSPGLAHQRLTPGNCNELLFDDVLWVEQAKRDHFDFVTKMRERNISTGCCSAKSPLTQLALAWSMKWIPGCAA